MTRTSRTDRFGSVLLGALALAGCDVPRTQLLVGVDAELLWGEGQALESGVLEVRRGDDDDRSPANTAPTAEELRSTVGA